MAPTDLGALARAYAGGTHGTRDEDGARSTKVVWKTEEIRHIPNAGTRGTRGTREHDDTGMSAGTVAMNGPLPMSPPPADRALPAAIAVRLPAEVPDQAQPAPPPSEPAWPPDLLLPDVPDHNVVLPSVYGAHQAPVPASIVASTIEPIPPRRWCGPREVLCDTLACMGGIINAADRAMVRIAACDRRRAFGAMVPTDSV